MEQNYRTDDGGLDWEFVQEIASDITDGYLRTVDGVHPKNANDPGRKDDSDTIGRPTGYSSHFFADQVLGRERSETSSDVEPNVLGSRLLKGVSRLHSICLDRTISEADEEQCLHRMALFAPIVLDLSKQYAREDETYLSHLHGEVAKICEAIITAKNTEGNESEGEDEDDEYTVKSLPKLSDMKDPSDKFHYVDMQDLESSRSEPSLPHKPLMFGSLPDPYSPNFSVPDEAKDAIEAADVDADEIVRELEGEYDTDTDTDTDSDTDTEVEKTVENILEEVRDFQKEYYQRHRRSIFGN